MRFLADLALFVEVAQAQNFSRAAATLGMPVSTLSRRMSALERELGCALIHRSTRAFRLTDAGLACYEQSKGLVAEAQRIQDDVTGVASRSAGHVRVGVPFDLAHLIFLPLFAQYMQEHPETSIEVQAISGHPNVLTEGLDVAIMVSHQLRLPDSSFAARRLGAFGRQLYASRMYLKRRGTPRDPEDLLTHDCVRMVHGQALSQWELRRGREQRTVMVSGTATANSVGMVATLVREGMGIAMLTESLAKDATFGNGLVRVLPEWDGVPAYLFAVTPAEMQTARVRRLIAYLKEGFAAALDGVS